MLWFTLSEVALISKQVTAVHIFDSILLRMLSVMCNKAIEKFCIYTHWCINIKFLDEKLHKIYWNTTYYAGTTLSCAGIQQWKSGSFHCWAAINFVGDMNNEEEDPSPPVGHQELRVEVMWAMRRRTPTHPSPLVIRNWELKWHEQWGGVPTYWDPGDSASYTSY